MMTRRFRLNWPVRLLTIGAGVLALAAVVAPGLLARAAGHPVIALPSIAPLDAGLRWTDSAAPPDTVQQLALDQLLGWLVALGWGTLAVGGIGGLALWAMLAAQRAPEVSIRRAVGASRRSLLGAMAGEGVGVAIAVTGVGTALGILGARVAASRWPGPTQAWQAELPVVALVVIGLAMIVGALFPLGSVRSRDVAERVDSPPPLWIPATQLGVGLASLVGAAMIGGQAQSALAPTHGGAARDATVYQLEHRGPLAEARARDYGQLLAGSGRRDSSTIVSLASPGGHDGIGTIDQLTTDCGQCYVGGIYLKWRPLRANYHTASADTFRARGFRILQGRMFTDDDRTGTAPVAIVNRYLAERYFQPGGPIGREVFLAGRMTGPAYRVIGVVDDRGPRGLGGELGPLETIYLSSLQLPGRHTELLVIGNSGELAVPGAVSVSSRTTENAVVRQRAAALRWFGLFFGLEGGVTLVLAVGGVAILMVMWVDGSRSDFAIRRAVGARRWQIRRFVLEQAVAVAGAGIGMGVVFFGPALWPELARLLPGGSSWQPRLVLSVAAGLTAVTVAAALGPAWRAGGSSRS